MSATQTKRSSVKQAHGKSTSGCESQPSDESRALTIANDGVVTECEPNTEGTATLRTEAPNNNRAAKHRPPRQKVFAADATRVKKGDSKQELVLARLRSARGASIAKLMELTGWQIHTVRGFLSAVVRKKLGLSLISETGKDGERRYRIVESGK